MSLTSAEPRGYEQRPTMAPIKKKRAGRYHHGDLRTAVMQAALALVERRGSLDFTTRELAKAAGVTHPALYRHFADKRALFVAIALAGHRLLYESMAALLATCLDRPSLILAFAETYVRFALEHPAHFRIMFGPRLNRDGRFPELEQAVTDAYERLLAAMGGSEKKTATSTAAAHDRAFALWSLVHGFTVLLLEDRVPGLASEGRVDCAAAQARRLVAPLAHAFA